MQWSFMDLKRKWTTCAELSGTWSKNKPGKKLGDFGREGVCLETGGFSNDRRGDKQCRGGQA
jgi:hypothetical protein